jgi:hypothetical protein
MNVTGGSAGRTGSVCASPPSARLIFRCRISPAETRNAGPMRGPKSSGCTGSAVKVCISLRPICLEARQLELCRQGRRPISPPTRLNAASSATRACVQMRRKFESGRGKKKRGYLFPCATA